MVGSKGNGFKEVRRGCDHRKKEVGKGGWVTCTVCGLDGRLVVLWGTAYGIWQ